MEAVAGVVVAFIILLVVYVALAIKIVQQFQKGLVERFGRYRKTVGPGFNMIVPFIEVMKRVDDEPGAPHLGDHDFVTDWNLLVSVGGRPPLLGLHAHTPCSLEAVDRLEHEGVFPRESTGTRWFWAIALLFPGKALQHRQEYHGYHDKGHQLQAQVHTEEGEDGGGGGADRKRKQEKPCGEKLADA